MMRLPRFRYLAPRALGDAALALSDGGPSVAVLAGGTDLIPNMKRRQQTPGTVIGLRGIASLRGRSGDGAHGFVIGALTRLSEIENDRAIAAAWPALSHSACAGCPPTSAICCSRPMGGTSTFVSRRPPGTSA